MDKKWIKVEKDPNRVLPEDAPDEIKGKSSFCDGSLCWSFNEPQPVELIKAMFRKNDIEIAVENGMAVAVVFKW